MNRDVALKILPDALPAILIAGPAHTRSPDAGTLNHPNIAAIYGFEESQDARALVMELVKGEPLSARIRRGPISLVEALLIAKQVADALEAAHEQGSSIAM